MDISAALTRAADILRDGGVAEPRREAASLLAFVLGRDDVYLIAHPDHKLTAEETDQYIDVIARRAKREPFQYIVGRQEFYGLDFRVTPDVPIPRPETEILVEAAINEIAGKEQPNFCEIGVGSGCISVSILHNVPSARAVGVDISPKALEIAKYNAELHGVIDRLDLRRGDVFEGVTGQFDMIVSNPPYVPDPQLEHLQEEVRQFEPHTALFGGERGLDIIERITSKARHFLLPGGVLLMEIGFDQSNEVSRLLSNEAWNEVRFLDDLQGIPRIVFARRC